MRVTPRVAIFTALLMAIPLGAWHFVFQPRNAMDAEIRSEIEAKQSKLRALNQATASVGSLQKEISSLEKALVFFQSKLPNEKEIDKVLQEVWRLAETNQLTTKSIRTLQRTAENSTDGPHAEQPITMQLDGDFLGLYSFLQALEEQPRIMRIRNMSLKRLDKGPRGCVQATFILSVFFEPNDKDTPCPPKS